MSVGYVMVKLLLSESNFFFLFGLVEDQNSLITELLLFVLEIRRKLKLNMLKGMMILKKKKTWKILLVLLLISPT